MFFFNTHLFKLFSLYSESENNPYTIKPYLCDLCGRTFQTLSARSKHHRMKHEASQLSIKIEQSGVDSPQRYGPLCYNLTAFELNRKFCFANNYWYGFYIFKRWLFFLFGNCIVDHVDDNNLGTYWRRHPFNLVLLLTCIMCIFVIILFVVICLELF